MQFRLKLSNFQLPVEKFCCHFTSFDANGTVRGSPGNSQQMIDDIPTCTKSDMQALYLLSRFILVVYNFCKVEFQLTHILYQSNAASMAFSAQGGMFPQQLQALVNVNPGAQLTLQQTGNYTL